MQWIHKLFRIDLQTSKMQGWEMDISTYTNQLLKPYERAAGRWSLAGNALI